MSTYGASQSWVARQKGRRRIKENHTNWVYLKLLAVKQIGPPCRLNCKHYCTCRIPLMLFFGSPCRLNRKHFCTCIRLCWCCVHLALITRTFREQTIVFIQTKKEAHRMHIVLGLLGVRVGELHGGLSQIQVQLHVMAHTHTDTHRQQIKKSASIRPLNLSIYLSIFGVGGFCTWIVVTHLA